MFFFFRNIIFVLKKISEMIIGETLGNLNI